MQPTLEILEQVRTEITAICKKYNITLVPVVVHQGDKTYCSVEIAPVKPPTAPPAQ